MQKAFSVNTNRYDPYKTFRFRVYFGTSTTPVAGVSKITALKRTHDPIDIPMGGNPIVRKGLGKTKYEPVSFERGVTHDSEFNDWADAAQQLDTGSAKTSLQNLRKDIRVELMNEAGQPVMGFMLHNCWVTEYQALPDLDAVAIESIKVVHEGWERLATPVEPKQI